MTKPPAPQPATNPANTTSGHVFRKIRKGSGSSKLITLMLGEINQDNGLRASTLEDMIVKMKMTLEHTCGECGNVWVSKSEDLLKSFDKETPLKNVRVDCECGSKKVTSIPKSM